MSRYVGSSVHRGCGGGGEGGGNGDGGGDGDGDGDGDGGGDGEGFTVIEIFWPEAQWKEQTT